MSKWSGDELERVRTATTIARFGETEKDILELVREQKRRDA